MILKLLLYAFVFICIIIIVGGLFYFFLFLTSKFTLWRLKKKYTIDNDLSRKGEEERKRLAEGFREERIRSSSAAESGVAGPLQSERRRLLQETIADTDGQTGDSTGKHKKSFGGIFKRIRRQ